MFEFTLKEKWGDGVMVLHIEAQDCTAALSKLGTLLNPTEFGCPWELM